MSFVFNYTTTKFFNIAQAATITLGAYFCFLFYKKVDLPISVSIPLSIFSCVALSVLCEIFIFRYMRKKGLSPFTLLIVSIGLYTIFQNIISLYFGDETLSIRTWEAKAGNSFLGGYITDIQIITIAVSILLFALVIFLLFKTSFGRSILAVSNNPELSKIYGIDTDKITLGTTIVSSAFAAIAGILIASDVDMTPTFGFNYFLYGVVAMIIGGVSNFRGLIFAVLLLSSSQQLAAYYFDTKWMDAVAFVILILFLFWKPLWISGQGLKKVEV